MKLISTGKYIDIKTTLKDPYTQVAFICRFNTIGKYTIGHLYNVVLYKHLVFT